MVAICLFMLILHLLDLHLKRATTLYYFAQSFYFLFGCAYLLVNCVTFVVPKRLSISHMLWIILYILRMIYILLCMDFDRHYFTIAFQFFWEQCQTEYGELIVTSIATAIFFVAFLGSRFDRGNVNLPAHIDPLPAHEILDPPPADEDLPPQNMGPPPAYEGLPPQNMGPPPAYEDLPPEDMNPPPAYEDFPPGHEDLSLGYAAESQIDNQAPSHSNELPMMRHHLAGSVEAMRGGGDVVIEIPDCKDVGIPSGFQKQFQS